MTEIQFVAGLATGFGAALLLLLAAAFKGYQVDNIRDQLFALRNEMFLYAYEEGVLDTAAHTHLRELMNALIRYAHQISLYRLLLLAWSYHRLRTKPTPPPLYVEWNACVEQLPQAQADRFRHFHTQMVVLLIKQMVTSSLLGWAAIILVGIYMFPKTLMTAGLKRLNMDDAAERLRNHMPVNLIEAEALKAGKLG